MSKLLLGTILGVVFGIVSVVIMIPMEMPDKRSAMLGAFADRFSIGFVIGAANFPIAAWLSGLFFGVLLSLPVAIVTKAYIPIMILGVVGGTLIGLMVGAWGV